ncbi:hypothetical protein [Dactylosporangium sp. CA-139066]|uniref:hypothetical protein n=1 Tax=Dactylosporangium sp. CA-139066 TaxID=3239930 RepID=UPI003D90D879
MPARRMFATRERGLSVDARLGGVAMGGTVAARGPATVEVDFAAPPEWTGHRLRVQALCSGRPMPSVVAECEFAVGDRARLRVSLDERAWLVLRIADPARPAGARAEGVFAEAGRTVAYLSPFFISPRR